MATARLPLLRQAADYPENKVADDCCRAGPPAASRSRLGNVLTDPQDLHRASMVFPGWLEMAHRALFALHAGLGSSAGYLQHPVLSRCPSGLARHWCGMAGMPVMARQGKDGTAMEPLGHPRAMISSCSSPCVAADCAAGRGGAWVRTFDRSGLGQSSARLGVQHCVGVAKERGFFRTWCWTDWCWPACLFFFFSRNAARRDTGALDVRA